MFSQEQMTTLSSLTYPGAEDDKAAAQRIFLDHSVKEQSLIQLKLKAMKTKQQLFEGNRSGIAPLQALDSTEWTYEGWKQDKEEVERRLRGDCSVLQLGSHAAFLQRMIKKQQLHDNRCNHVACLQELEAAVFNYPNWQDDKRLAHQYYADYPTPVRFYEKFHAMQNKQRLHEGDRSHADIVALDSVTFTYPNWQQDHQDYLARHTGDCSLFQMGISCPALLQKMMKKQQLHTDRSSIPLLQALDSGNFHYPDWQADAKLAEGYYTDFSSPDRFGQKLQAMKHKQQFYEGDRSHPNVVALDSTPWSYTGWQADKQDALHRHTGDCTVLQLGTFHLVLTKMKKRQALHDQQQTVLDTLSGVNALLSSSSFGSLTITDNCATKSATAPTLTRNNKSDLDKKCVVCLEEAPTHAFIPCGHMCCCEECVPKITVRPGDDMLKCPLCRKNAVVVTRIFSS